MFLIKDKQKKEIRKEKTDTEMKIHKNPKNGKFLNENDSGHSNSFFR
jgi:hypothetical protein